MKHGSLCIVDILRAVTAAANFEYLRHAVSTVAADRPWHCYFCHHQWVSERSVRDLLKKIVKKTTLLALKNGQWFIAGNSHKPLNFLIGTPVQQYVIIFFHKGYAAVNFNSVCIFRIWIALHYRLVTDNGCLRNGRVNQCSQRDIHAMYMYDAMKYLGWQQGHLYIIWRLIKR